MKSAFRFELLQEKRKLDNIDQSSVYFRMLELTKNRKAQYLPTVSTLDSQLPSGEYFIAQNLVVTKGKTQFFRGEIFIVEKASLLEFLLKLFNTNDMRDFIISPKFSASPSLTIFISDDYIAAYETAQMNCQTQ